MGRDGSVGIAVRYGMDSSGTRPDRLWGPPSLLYNGYRVLPGLKRPGRGVDHAPPSSAEVKERVELYPYSPTPLPGLRGVF
jgi:hypothetical protein